MWVGELLMVECGLPKGNSPKIYTGREGGVRTKGGLEAVVLFSFLALFSSRTTSKLYVAVPLPPFSQKEPRSRKRYDCFSLSFLGKAR